ncbi:ATP-binding cassette domain-containing protein, partial [Streptomyces beijiangensis]|uniref:ATP-binding cassette domain-containing protein n=1 Tax=Streptomyces beijiangensis TaxID=163361 RepID=UPI0035575B8C
LTWQLGPGDRIGLVGVNGAGKTSLLRALTEAARSEGETQPTAGRIHVGKTVKLAYLSQEVAELNPNLAGAPGRAAGPRPRRPRQGPRDDRRPALREVRLQQGQAVDPSRRPVRR